MRRKRCRLILFGAHIAGQDRPRRIRLPSHGDGRLIRRSPLLRETRCAADPTKITPTTATQTFDLNSAFMSSLRSSLNSAKRKYTHQPFATLIHLPLPTTRSTEPSM